MNFNNIKNYFFFILIDIHLIVSRLILLLLILQTFICTLNFLLIFLDCFSLIINDLFQIFYENSHTFCQDNDTDTAEVILNDETINQIIDTIYNNFIINNSSDGSMRSYYLSSSNSSNSNTGSEEMGARDILILLDTYTGLIEERLDIRRYFYSLHNSSSLISINPCFFHIITENLILENTRIANDIELALNSVSITNIRRDNMVIFSDEYREIFGVLNFHIMQILKTVKISTDSYLLFINSENIPLVQKFFYPKIHLDNLVSINIESFFKSRTISNDFFQSFKNLTIFLDQTLHLLTLNNELFEIIGDGERIIDNDIGFDFNPRAHPVNPLILNAENMEQLMFLYEPHVFDIDLQNMHRQPPFPTQLVNRGFYLLNN